MYIEIIVKQNPNYTERFMPDLKAFFFLYHALIEMKSERTIQAMCRACERSCQDLYLFDALKDILYKLITE